MSKSLDPDQARHFVGSDLEPNCLQKLSAEDIRRQRVQPHFHWIVLNYTGTGHGLFGGDERVVYWKCEAGQVLKENLTIPLNNKAREKALLLASQQVRTSLE